MKNILDCELYQDDLKRISCKVECSLFENSNFLVTGGLGLIGSAIVDLLLTLNKEYKLNIHIYVAARNKELYEKKYLSISEAEFIYYDALKPISFDLDIDYIVCCAGVASPDLFVLKPVETMLANIEGIRNLLDYAKSHKNVKRVLYVSSSEIYGIKDTLDAFEEDKYGVVDVNNIRSSYPEAKRASELLCKSYTSEYDINTVIIRPGHIFGPTASLNDKKISSDFAYRAAKGKTLKMISSGLQKRSYCYSLDCALAILIVLMHGEKGESYNVGNDEAISIREMTHVLASAGNVELIINKPTKEESKQFNPMNNSSLNINKLKALGYENVFSIEEDLIHTVEILKKII